MCYKVIKNGKIIDVLDELCYLKYQSKYSRMCFSSKEDAQAIFSSDRTKIWHVDGLYEIPVEGYDTVQLEEIDRYEYERLRMLHCATAEELIDGVISDLVNSNFNLQNFTESLSRLYSGQIVDKSRIMSLFGDAKITEEQMNDILKINN